MTTSVLPLTLTQRDELLRRAHAVVPGGMYGHLSTVSDLMPEGYPQYFERGEGALLWDVDGNEYIDFMCAFGPMISGYANPLVDEAAIAQLRFGDPLTGPSPRMVELAELLVDTVAHADWAMFAKNGTDATTIAVMTARAETGRDILLRADHAYHGANPWFTPMDAGVTAADRANLVNYDYNDLASLEAAAAAHDGKVAAIIVSPFRHDANTPQEYVDPVFARGARALADRIGAVLIMDEVRSCLRIDPAGAWESVGVRPDLTAYSKSLANGHPIAAVVGTEALKDAASRIYVTGSFWYAGAPMAAALVNITHFLEIDGVGIVNRAGERLRAGLAAQAERYGFDLRQTGPAQMPLVQFAGDVNFARGFAFGRAAINRGVFIHPWHNMFLSTAHTDEVIDRALERLDDAFAELSRSGL